MAETLLGNLLGQTSNSTSSGLLGGPSIFQTQPSRGQRRSALLSQAISSQGSNPYARLGAAFGGLIGMGGRAAGEGLGILQEPEQVRQSRLITEAQQAAAESGIDPVAEPERFLEVIDPIVESDPLLKSGIRSQIVRLQRELAPEPIEPATFFNQETNEYVRGGYRNGVAVNERGQPLGQGFVERDFEVPERPDPVNYDRVRIIDPETGNPVIADYDSRTRNYFVGDRVIRNPDPAPSRIEQGGPGEFQLSQKQDFDTRKVRANVRSYIETAEDAVELLEEQPNINTLTARGASLVNNLQQEVVAITQEAGFEVDEDLLDPSRYAEQFDSLGIENARMRGLITSLAFQAAAASGQTGRDVTERDLVRFIAEVGATSSDSRAFSATITDSVDRNVRNLRILSQELEVEPLGSDFTFRGQPIGLTREELEQSRGSGSDGAGASNTQGGVVDWSNM